MHRKILSQALVLFILISTLFGTGIIPSVLHTVKANPVIIYVPDSYSTIQGAVNAASPGDTVVVRAGIYGENILINKSLTLIGEDRNATVISGGHLQSVIQIISPHVVIMNFTLQNSGDNPDDSGILLFGAINTTVRNNIITYNHIGIHLRHGSNGTLVINNLILNNTSSGIRLADNNNFNYIIGNSLTNNTAGVEIHTSSFSMFYHNNFIRNRTYQVQILGGVSNRWDDGIEGNYWSDYHGSDTTQPPDGIGDTDLPIWEDNHPIMNPWSGSATHVFSVEPSEDPIIVNTNCTIALFSFNQTSRQISFRTTGPPVVYFFCYVTVPKTILNAASSEDWQVKLNDTDISSEFTVTDNSTSICFTHILSIYEAQISVAEVDNGMNFFLYAIGGGAVIGIIAVTTFVVLKKRRAPKAK